MLFITYWKLSENISQQEVVEIAQTLDEEGLFPPDAVELHRWDGTPDGWGICVWEADDYHALDRALNMWRASGTPFFEETKTAPAAPVEEIVSESASLFDELPT